LLRKQRKTLGNDAVSEWSAVSSD